MKPSHEMIVRADDLAKAAMWVNRGIRAQREETHLYQGEDGFVVEAPRARTRVLAAGIWSSPVTVNAGILARLAGKLSSKADLTLMFVNGRLYLDRTSIPAKEGSSAAAVR